jgi:hypothetical protein
MDTPGWTDTGGTNPDHWGCEEFVKRGFCKDGVLDLTNHP